MGAEEGAAWLRDSVRLPQLNQLFLSFDVNVVVVVAAISSFCLFAPHICEQLLVLTGEVFDFLRQSKYGLLHLVALKLPLHAGTVEA